MKHFAWYTLLLLVIATNTATATEPQAEPISNTDAVDQQGPTQESVVTDDQQGLSASTEVPAESNDRMAEEGSSKKTAKKIKRKAKRKTSQHKKLKIHPATEDEVNLIKARVEPCATTCATPVVVTQTCAANK